MNIWREFGRRCAQFKRLSQQGAEAKPNKTVLATKDINNNNVVCVANRNCGPGETPKISVKNKFEFEEWDSRENESFLITRERLEGDQICTVKCEGASNKENVHFFMEENEDLHLSEDESEVSYLEDYFESHEFIYRNFDSTFFPVFFNYFIKYYLKLHNSIHFKNQLIEIYKMV